MLDRKITNDAAAYIQALAAGHGRNPALAERMVRHAVNVTAVQARSAGSDHAKWASEIPQGGIPHAAPQMQEGLGQIAGPGGAIVLGMSRDGEVLAYDDLAPGHLR